MSSRPIDTIQLLLAVIGLIKSAAVAISVVTVEWALAKKAHAEKKSIVSENEHQATVKKNKLQEVLNDKDAIDIVDDIVNRSRRDRLGRIKGTDETSGTEERGGEATPGTTSKG